MHMLYFNVNVETMNHVFQTETIESTNCQHHEAEIWLNILYVVVKFRKYFHQFWKKIPFNFIYIHNNSL